MSFKRPLCNAANATTSKEKRKRSQRAIESFKKIILLLNTTSWESPNILHSKPFDIDRIWKDPFCVGRLYLRMATDWWWWGRRRRHQPVSTKGVPLPLSPTVTWPGPLAPSCTHPSPEAMGSDTAPLACMGEFVPLYSCLRTLRERYRSQNCDIGGTSRTH